MADVSKELSTYINAAYVDSVGEITATIRESRVEQVGQERKRVLYLTGEDKGLPLNKTQLKALAGHLGTESDNWVGARVTLFTVETTNPSGQPVRGVRIRFPKD